MKPKLIDETDRLIIRALDNNARSSATQISQWLGESKQKVAWRLRRLMKLGILDIASAIIAKTRLGYFHGQIYLKIDCLPPEKEILNQLSSIPSLHWESIAVGRYNLIIFIMVKTLAEYWQVYNQIINAFATALTDKEILLSSTTHFSNLSYLTGEPKRTAISEFPKEEIKLKSRDLALINALKEHGRININALARQLHASPHTVAQRLAYLRRLKMITAYKVRINHNLLGFKDYFILLALPRLAQKEKNILIEQFNMDKSTIRLTETIGSYDMVVEVVFPPSEKPHLWLKDILKKNNISSFRYHILSIKKVLPINTVVYR